MITTSIEGRELIEGWVDEDPSIRYRFDFALHADTGCESTAVVYFEIEPGRALATHTDSAEEVILVLDGEGVATVGDERVAVRSGDLALVPALVPHGMEATGERTLRCVGFFSAATLEHVFGQVQQPLGVSVVHTPFVGVTA